MHIIYKITERARLEMFFLLQDAHIEAHPSKPDMYIEKILKIM